MNNFDECTGRKYLVTGSSGFIGRAVCDRLLSLGAKVHGTSRREVHLTSDNWRHWKIDLTDADGVDQLLNEVKPDFLIHLAGCVSGKREIEWVRETLAGNLVSAVNVLVSAHKTGVTKSVMAGSLEEPDIADSHPVPASPYAASKWAASGYARMMYALYGMNVAVARIFMVYGPGQQDLAKFVPYVCIASSRSETPKLMSGGRPVDWVYIDDVVSGLIQMSLSGPVDGSHVDLGSGKSVTTGQVAERICKIAATGVKPEIGALPDRAMEQVRVADARATRDVLGWSAETSLDAGLESTYHAYRENAAEPANTPN